MKVIRQKLHENITQIRKEKKFCTLHLKTHCYPNVDVLYSTI